MKFEYGTMNICKEIWVYGICAWFFMDTCLGLYGTC